MRMEVLRFTMLCITFVCNSYAFDRFSGHSSSSKNVTLTRSEAEQIGWECGAVYAFQGRRFQMEDHFIFSTINGTNITIFGILDGHAGDFAAIYAKEELMEKFKKKIPEILHIAMSRMSQKNDFSNYDGDMKKIETAPPTLGTEKVATNNSIIKPIEHNATYYVDTNNNINWHHMISDLVLLTDYELVEKLKIQNNWAGTTLLLALLYKNQLIVANVGDSRGVMCDGKDRIIPLSFDHKPNEDKEFQRITAAGGFIEFHGVWRVNGIMATSRSLGDYTFKENQIVIANPDILTFDLNDYKAKFIILASDGLWNTFSNEEAVAFIANRLHEPHFGAKSIAMESYERGSEDNITVMVIVFKNGRYQIATSTN